MSLRSDDPKDARSAHKERQKIMHKKDCRKGKQSHYARGPKEWKAANAFPVYVHGPALVGHVLGLEKRLEKAGTSYVGDEEEVGHSCASYEKEREERREVDLMSLAKPVHQRARDSGADSRTLELESESDFLSSVDWDADCDAMERDALALALALSLSEVDSEDRAPNMADTDGDIDDADAFLYLDSELCSEMDLDSLLGETESEVDWVDLSGCVTQDLRTSGFDCGRPTYAQMTKLEVT